MKLRCQFRGTRCPAYSHEGTFEATDEILTRFDSDLNRCAKCTAWAPPALPSFQDDLLQIARITLWKKGPLFDPNHERKASFRTYILPRICGALTREKTKELQHYQHFTSPLHSETKEDSQERFLSSVIDAQGAFEDTLIWDLWTADFERELPQLLNCLTQREQQVFRLIRRDIKQCEIAETLGVSTPRISQLLKQVEFKLTRECQRLGMIE